MLPRFSEFQAFHGRPSLITVHKQWPTWFWYLYCFRLQMLNVLQTQLLACSTTKEYSNYKMVPGHDDRFSSFSRFSYTYTYIHTYSAIMSYLIHCSIYCSFIDFGRKANLKPVSLQEWSMHISQYCVIELSQLLHYVILYSNKSLYIL